MTGSGMRPTYRLRGGVHPDVPRSTHHPPRGMAVGGGDIPPIVPVKGYSLFLKT